MAEAALGKLASTVIKLLDGEAKLLGGVHEEIESLKGEVESIMTFVNNADGKANVVDDCDKVRVKHLREAALQSESVIEKYSHLMAQQQCRDKSRFFRYLQIFSCLIIQLKPRHEIASKVQELRRKLKDISEWRERYRIHATSQGSSSTTQNNTWNGPREDVFFLEENQVVGFESATKELIEVLESESPKRTVVSVVGMGGLGKTTLAHRVYNCVKGSFDCHAWIDVSQSYDALSLLKNLMKKLCESKEESLPQGVDEMDKRTMTSTLRDYLQGKKYVIVFDDVWNEGFWGDVKNVLGNSKSGRAVITTRHEEVANFCMASSFVHTHHLQRLPPYKAWELFCKKAFQYRSGGHCPPNLEDMSRSIVEKCQGLPLAIIVIAGLLSTKNQDVDEWTNLLSSLRSELESNQHLAPITKILSLSYYDLPPHLKSCFLHFGIFPEDYSIRRRRLFRHWIAEGFVCPKNDRKIESIAEDYLKQLIARSLVQVAERDFDGKPERCRVHDLLHDMILNKMEDLNFCQVLQGDCSNFSCLARRVSIFPAVTDVSAFKNHQQISHVRSIFIFDKKEIPNHVIRMAPENFKFVKLLDFEDGPSLENIPEDIGRLVFLKYLSVRGTKVKHLPKSIGQLVNLETLDLKNTLVNELPVEINRLRKLRHLMVYYIDRSIDYHFNKRTGVKINNGIGQLKALEKLYYIEVDVVESDVFKEMMELTNLKKLGIKKLRSEDGKKLCMCIQKMERLESLEIFSTSEDETIDLESMSPSPPKLLKRLSLHGRLNKFPEWLAELKFLIRIVIRWSKLEDDPLKVLKNLPELLELLIHHDAFYGEKLKFEADGAFPKLKEVQLYKLSRVESVVIEEGALPNLEELYIGSCQQLKEVPPGLHHLTNLKCIRFREMSPEFLFQSFDSIRSVPDVQFFHNYMGTLKYFSFEDVDSIQNHMLQKGHGDVDWNSQSAFDEIVEEALYG